MIFQALLFTGALPPSSSFCSCLQRLPFISCFLFLLHDFRVSLFSLRSRQAILFPFPFMDLLGLLQVLLAGKFTLVPTCEIIHSLYRYYHFIYTQFACEEVYYKNGKVWLYPYSWYGSIFCSWQHLPPVSPFQCRTGR